MVVLTKLKNYFLAGLLTVIPLLLILLLAQWSVDLLDSVFWLYLPEDIQVYYTPLAGIGFIFVSLIIIGWLVSSFVGHYIVMVIDKLLSKFPVIRSVYKGYRRLMRNILSPSSKDMQQAVLVEYPIKDNWVIGFVTGNTSKDITKVLKGKYVNVFVPSTPSPASGTLLIVKKENIRKLDINKAKALELIVTAGISDNDK
ncbi:MAG: DUF502 domain-containing protein [Alphaproteobacteria bacterium]